MTPFHLNKALFNPALYARIHEVWFAGLPAGAKAAPMELTKRWFGVGAPEDRARFDALCSEHFAAALESVGPAAYPLPSLKGTAPGAASPWAAEQALAGEVAAPFLPECTAAPGEDERARNALSLILLLDQIPRNIFRDNQSAIHGHYDCISRSLLHSLLRLAPRPDLAPSVRLAPALRSWFYLPLMHSEYLEDHARYGELMAEFRADVVAASGGKETASLADIDNSIAFGKRHAVIIEKFGRYPYRNGYLGRETTAEEREYMESGGESFGSGKA